MTPTKILLGQTLVVFAIVFLGLWASTQWVAAMLGYQPELGLPWFMLGGLPDCRARHTEPITAAAQPRNPLAAAKVPPLSNTSGA